MTRLFFVKRGFLSHFLWLNGQQKKEVSSVNLQITVSQPDQAAMDQFKRRLGQTILTLNEDILCLQKNYRLLKDSGGGGERQESLKKSTEELEDKVYQKKKTLEDAKVYLQNNMDSLDGRKAENYIKLLATTMKTGRKCLELKEGVHADLEEINRTVTEINDEIYQENESNRSLDSIMGQLEEVPEENEESQGYEENLNVLEEDEEKAEFSCLTVFEQQRYNKNLHEIETCFKSISENLKNKWKNDSDILDCLSLRECKAEFDNQFKHWRHQMSLWENKNKDKVRLSACLDDEMDHQFKSYMKLYLQ